MLNLHPDTDAKHSEMVQLLSAGMPFDQLPVRNEIASILQTYPTACRDTLIVGLVVSPVEHIDTWIPDVKDKRRVGVVSIEECMEVQPLECTYTMADNGAANCDLGSLKRILRKCREALVRDIEAGAMLATQNGVEQASS